MFATLVPAPATESRSRRAASTANHLAFRIVSPQRQGQIIRVGGAKVLIGSHENCHLRLKGAGIQPAHCLILRGDHGTFVRCVGTDTRLNGWSFQDAPLFPGDRLSIGPIDLELIENAPLNPRENAPVDTNSASDLTPETESPTASETPSAALAQLADHWLTRLRQTRQIQHQRLRRCVGQIRELNSNVTGLETSVRELARNVQLLQTAQQNSSAESSALAEELRQAQAELLQRQQELEQHDRQWEQDKLHWAAVARDSETLADQWVGRARPRASTPSQAGQLDPPAFGTLPPATPTLVITPANVPSLDELEPQLPATALEANELEAAHLEAAHLEAAHLEDTRLDDTRLEAEATGLASVPPVLPPAFGALDSPEVSPELPEFTVPLGSRTLMLEPEALAIAPLEDRFDGPVADLLPCPLPVPEPTPTTPVATPTERPTESSTPRQSDNRRNSFSVDDHIGLGDAPQAATVPIPPQDTPSPDPAAPASGLDAQIARLIASSSARRNRPPLVPDLPDATLDNSAATPAAASPEGPAGEWRPDINNPFSVAGQQYQDWGNANFREYEELLSNTPAEQAEADTDTSWDTTGVSPSSLEAEADLGGFAQPGNDAPTTDWHDAYRATQPLSLPVGGSHEFLSAAPESEFGGGSELSESDELSELRRQLAAIRQEANLNGTDDPGIWDQDDPTDLSDTTSAAQPTPWSAGIPSAAAFGAVADEEQGLSDRPTSYYEEDSASGLPAEAYGTGSSPLGEAPLEQDLEDLRAGRAAGRSPHDLPPVHAGVAAEPTADPDDDSSIESYMNQLMQRLGSGSYNPQSLKPQTPPSTSSSSTSTSTPPLSLNTANIRLSSPVPNLGGNSSSADLGLLDPPEPIDTLGDESKPASPAWPRPRNKSVPDAVSKLDAFRDVANQNARSAITRHSMQQARQAIVLRVFVGFVAIAVGAIVSAWIESIWSAMTLLAVLCGVGSGWAMFDAVQLYLKARSGPKPSGEPAARLENLDDVVDADLSVNLDDSAEVPYAAALSDDPLARLQRGSTLPGAE